MSLIPCTICTLGQVKIWKDNGVLRPEHFDVIQDRLDEMNIPQGIGRVPNKIHSKFSGLTADQWRNWTNLFSLYALHDILPPDHYLCWSKFVQASIVFCQYSLSFNDINLADKKLMEFSKNYMVKTNVPQTCTCMDI